MLRWAVFTFYFIFCIHANAHHLHDRNQTIVIGYAENWAPYSYTASDGTPQGIFIQLMNKIFNEKLKLKIIHQVVPWKRAQILTQTGQYDAIFTSINQERLKTMVASQAFYNLEWRLFMSKTNYNFKNIQQMDDPLKNKDVHYLSVLGDQTTENFYRDNNLTFDTVKSVNEAVNMLNSGRSSLFLHSKLTTLYALYHFSLHEQIAMHSKTFATIPFHVLISKKAAMANELIKAVDEVVTQLKKSGELEKFIEMIEEKEITRVLEKSNLN